MFKEISGNYDNIYSIFYNRQVAYHLKINYLCFESGPFGWFTTNHLKTINENLLNQFESFFAREYGSLWRNEER